MVQTGAPISPPHTALSTLVQCSWLPGPMGTQHHKINTKPNKTPRPRGRRGREHREGHPGSTGAPQRRPVVPQANTPACSRDTRARFTGLPWLCAHCPLKGPEFPSRLQGSGRTQTANPCCHPSVCRPPDTLPLLLLGTAGSLWAASGSQLSPT